MIGLQNPYGQVRKANQSMNPQAKSFKTQKTFPNKNTSLLQGTSKPQMKSMKTAKIEEDEKQVEIQLAQHIYPVSQNPPLQPPQNLQAQNPFAAKTSLPPVQPEPGTISQILEGIDQSALNNDNPENQNLAQPKQGASASKEEDNKDEMEGARNVADSFNF